MPSCARNGAGRPITELIGDVEIETFALVPDANAEEMLVQVRHQRRVMRIRHGVFVEYVASADMPAVVEIARRAQFDNTNSTPSSTGQE